MAYFLKKIIHKFKTSTQWTFTLKQQVNSETLDQPSQQIQTFTD